MKKIIILLIFFAMIQPAVAIGIGIAPAEINFNNALKGSEYESSITIFNTDSEATNFSLKATGDIGDWVSFYNLNDIDNTISSIKIPGQDKAAVVVRIKVPSDAVNANYTVSLDVMSIPDTTDKAQGSGQALIIGASSKVTLAVTGDQIIDGNVLGIFTENTEPGYPLKITTRFQNTGNVVVKPKIVVTILQDNNIINSFSHETTSVKPGNTQPIIAEWMTTAANIPADYTANIDVLLTGSIIKSDNLSFKILPVGTLTQSGNLTNIYVDGEPAVDNIVKVRAYFTNTGQIENQAKFSAEVYRDNKLIDTISSDELTVPKNEETVLISYLKITEPGDYLIKGKVIYSGKETPVEEVSLNVGKSTPGFEGISLIAVMLLLVMFRGKKKSRKI